MTLINHNWLNSHASRKYPLDDIATGIDDTGLILPDDVILDLHLSWPVTAGKYAFIGGVTITARLVSIVFMVTNDLDDTESFTPLGAVSLTKPFAINAQHAITPVLKGAGGFIALGDVDEATSLRFSLPTQSLIAAKVTKPYRDLPVSSIRKTGRNTGLTGIVKLMAGPATTVEQETVLVNGELRDAVVIQLAATSVNNVLKDYIGPCGGRPESNTCAVPGIETISGVVPDCDGNINVIFRGMAYGKFPECNSEAAGFVVDQGIGLADVCQSRISIERFIGEDRCASEMLSSSVSESATSLSSEGEAIPSLCGSLPFIECFPDSGRDAAWDIVSGSISATHAVPIENPDTAAECCISGCIDNCVTFYSTNTRNIAIWDSCRYLETVNQRITTDVQLIINGFGVPTSAGIILNYVLTGTKYTYWMAAIDTGTNTAYLYRYNGTSFTPVASQYIAADVLRKDTWYRLSTLVSDIGGGSVNITLTVTALTASDYVSANTVIATVGVDTDKYGTPVGKHGFGTLLSGSALFNYWRLTNE